MHLLSYVDPDGKRYKHHHKNKARSFLGVKNTRPGSSTRVKTKRGAKADAESHSIIYGFSKKKITHLKVGSRKVKLTKYGSRHMKASSRGEKPRLSKKQSSKNTKYSRGKASAYSGQFVHRLRSNSSTIGALATLVLN